MQFTTDEARPTQLATVIIAAFLMFVGRVLSPPAAHAQDTLCVSDFALRSSGSFAFIQSRPQGTFRQNVGLGYGANAAYLYRLDNTGVFGLRVDIGVVNYGEESRQAALSESVGGRVQLRVKTANYIIPMSIGPEMMWPKGSFRPYVNAGIGGQAFLTESRVESMDGSSLASTTNHSAFARSLVAGGGVYMPIVNGKTKVSLDFGMQYLNGSRADYLTPGSIIDLPDSQIRITPSQSDTHMIVVRIGARIGL